MLPLCICSVESLQTQQIDPPATTASTSRFFLTLVFVSPAAQIGKHTFILVCFSLFQLIIFFCQCSHAARRSQVFSGGQGRFITVTHCLHFRTLSPSLLITTLLQLRLLLLPPTGRGLRSKTPRME